MIIAWVVDNGQIELTIYPKATNCAETQPKSAGIIKYALRVPTDLLKRLVKNVLKVRRFKL